LYYPGKKEADTHRTECSIWATKVVGKHKDMPFISHVILLHN